jgi:hypothetical protein
VTFEDVLFYELKGFFEKVIESLPEFEQLEKIFINT